MQATKKRWRHSRRQVEQGREVPVCRHAFCIHYYRKVTCRTTHAEANSGLSRNVEIQLRSYLQQSSCIHCRFLTDAGWAGGRRTGLLLRGEERANQLRSSQRVTVIWAVRNQQGRLKMPYGLTCIPSIQILLIQPTNNGTGSWRQRWR